MEKGSYITQNKWETKEKMQEPRDDAKTKGVQKRKKIAINKVILFYHQLHILVQFFPLNPYGCKHSSRPYSRYCNKSMLVIHSEFCYGVSVCNSGERKQNRDILLSTANWQSIQRK